jgi:hypothetical protein
MCNTQHVTHAQLCLVLPSPSEAHNEPHHEIRTTTISSLNTLFVPQAFTWSSPQYWMASRSLQVTAICSKVSQNAVQLAGNDRSVKAGQQFTTCRNSMFVTSSMLNTPRTATKNRGKRAHTKRGLRLGTAHTQSCTCFVGFYKLTAAFVHCGYCSALLVAVL